MSKKSRRAWWQSKKGKKSPEKQKGLPPKTGKQKKSAQGGSASLARQAGREEKLKIYALGGLEEVGRNMVVFELGSDIVIVDMGLQFPEEDMHGIDYIIPNISSLKGKEKNIRAVIVTH